MEPTLQEQNPPNEANTSVIHDTQVTTWKQRVQNGKKNNYHK